MNVEIRKMAFDPFAELQQYQASLSMGAQYGACASFIGSMRDFNEGEPVQSMVLEYYPGMTEKYLQKISAEALERWDLLDSLIIHRVGDIKPADSIVLVAVWSAHRAAAFEACRYLMEELKSRAPFWKKESLATGARWVEKNTPG